MSNDINMSEKELINHFKENYAKVRKLREEDSKNDPDSEPYLSKYKAKDILLNLQELIKNETAKDCRTLGKTMLDAMLGIVLLNIGIINMETEELSASVKILTEAVELLKPISTAPEVVTTLINVYNNLGIVFATLDNPTQSKCYLLLAKEVYTTFKCTSQMPLLIEYMLSLADENVTQEVVMFEKAHTLTHYYLAQVYGSLKENVESAIYCHITLKRQLQYSDFEPIDWSLNAATLSQFFAEQNGFLQSRHHLAAASTVLGQYFERLQMNQSEDETYLAEKETYEHRAADVARCWVKYCLLLMNASKTRLMDDNDKAVDSITDMSNLKLEDDDDVCGGDIKNLKFPELDVSLYENKITASFLLTYEDAREVFLSCQSWINKAKEYYKKDTLASDFIQLTQDSSQCYNHLAFFEEDDERRAKMHKRRVDILEELIKEVNPTYYLQFCRQLWYELAEVYSDILNIKLEKLNNKEDKPLPHTLKKINMLCEKSMENYEHFLNSVKDKNGKIPVKLDADLIRPVITAYAFIGRNSMKRVALDKTLQLNHLTKSYDSYQAIVDICTNDPDAATIMPVEYGLCQEMVKILPIKINQLKIGIQ